MIRLLAVLVLASGCSVALQAKPRAAAKCSTTPAFWIADSVGVAAGAAAITTGLAMDSGDTANAVAGVGVIAGIVYLASAHNGYRWSRECSSGPTSVASR